VRAVPLHDQSLADSMIDADGHEPIDLSAVQADEELINALHSGYPVVSAGHGGIGADDRVAAILASWRVEVEAEPVPELVDLDTAVATIAAAGGGSRMARRSAKVRHLAPLAAAAALLVITMGGVSIGSYSAQPDDVLWPVSKVLFAERAASVEAADRVQDHIDRAKHALAVGRPDAAAQELQRARADLGAIRPEEGQIELADVQDFLLAKAAETPPGTVADLTAPLSTQPSRPVPSGVLQPTDPADQSPLPSDAATSPSVLSDTTSRDPRQNWPNPDSQSGTGTRPDTSDATVPRETGLETTAAPDPSDGLDPVVPLPPGDDVAPETTSREPELTTTLPDAANRTEGQAPADSSTTSGITTTDTTPTS
jgi:hypothetical protein